MLQEFYSNGKLLLSGEYAILDGAKGLAVPTKFGQSLQISPRKDTLIAWSSIDTDKKIWFTVMFGLKELDIIETSDEGIASTLQKILAEAKSANPTFLKSDKGFEVTTKLSFPRKWGLGTSSTLINNIAQWAKVDAHRLLWNSFGGSGYDISCAQHNTPILYHIENNIPKVAPVTFNPPFKDVIFFVYLNQKQSSKSAIKNYRSKNFNCEDLIEKLNAITIKMTSTDDLATFTSLVESHEELLSNVLEIAPVKEHLFSDYSGAVKSLGGWGGDFVMAMGNEKTPEYFKSKGFNTVISYTEMVLY